MLATENGQNDGNTALACKDKVISSLRHLLDSGDEVDKCNASRALGSIGATEAIDDLVLRLGDEDIDVCIDAAEALGKLRAEKVVPTLLDSLLNDPDGELKTALVKALGVIGDPRSIPLLMEIAEHPPEEMVRDSNEDWDDWWDMQREAVIALGNMRAEQATSVLQALLTEEEALDIEQDILKALVKIGVAGEKIVIQQLQASAALSRRRAANALALSRNSETLKPLAAMLRDSSEEVRLSALNALVERKATKYLGAIELLKRDRSEKVRQAAILAYDRLARPTDTETEGTPAPRSDLLQDPDAEVRATYLNSLQQAENQIDDVDLQQLVFTALSDRNDQVLQAAIPLLAMLPEPREREALLIDLMQRPKLTSPLLLTCIQTLTQMSRWNDSVAQAMKRLISHDDGSIRLAALQALMSMEREIDALKMTGQENTPIDIIDEALNGRIVLEVEVAAEPVEADPVPVETAVAETAAAEDAAPATSTLESIMQDNQQVQDALRESNNTPQTDEEHDAALAEYSDLVQKNVVRGEWLFGNKERVSAARDVPRLAARVLSGLPAHLSAQKTARIVDSLLSALNSGDEKLRCDAADAIARIATDNPRIAEIEYAYGGLVTQFHNEQWDLKLACMRALAAIRNRAAIPILMSALDHQRPALRVEALHSITELLLHGNAPVKNAHMPEEPPTLTEWVNRLIDCLRDAESGIRYAAVADLKKCLRTEEIAQQQELTDLAIEKIIAAAFDNQGGRTRDMALVLKEVAPVQGTASLLQLLQDLSGSYDRRFAIEMLEEIYRTAPKRPESDSN